MTLRFGLADPRAPPSNRVSVAPAPDDEADEADDEDDDDEEIPPPLPLEPSYSPDC